LNIGVSGSGVQSVWIYVLRGVESSEVRWGCFSSFFSFIPALDIMFLLIHLAGVMSRFILSDGDNMTILSSLLLFLFLFLHSPFLLADGAVLGHRGNLLLA